MPPSVTFKVKDYRIEGPDRYTSMMLDVAEFIRRFLLHILPKGFHRIRHYGLFAGTAKVERQHQIRTGWRVSTLVPLYQKFV